MTNSVTSDKGDVGTACIIADLTKNGIKVAIPLSQHLPFDIIAINSSGKLFRVQVKYAKIIENGIVRVSTQTTLTSKKGNTAHNTNFDIVDVFAVYCPDNQNCYYLPKSKLMGVKNLWLRTDEQKQARKNANYAKDFQNLQTIFV